MSESSQEPFDGEDDVRQLLPRRRVPWSAVFIACALLGAVGFAAWLYARVEQRGLSLRGPGHLVRLPDGEVWAFFLNDGTLVRVTAESASKAGVVTGRCTRLQGALEGRDYVLDAAECQPGGLQDVVVERMRRAGLTFGYWDKALASQGETLDAALETVEIYASMIDPRADAPQLVALYRPLFADVLPAARRRGLPPPVFISVPRNDLSIVRVTRSELTALMQLPAFVFAGAAPAGGWIVRRVERAADGHGSLERLLVAPTEAPWPTRLAAPTLRVAPVERPGDPPAAGSDVGAGAL